MKPLHASEAKLLLQCPAKWKHAYRSRRVPAKESEALSRGRAVHEYLEAWWRGDDVMPAISDTLALCLCISYDGYYLKPNLSDVRVEVPFDTRFDGVHIAGTVDAIGLDKDGRQVIVEHKTTSQDISQGSVYWQKVMTCDLQVSLYRAAFPGARILYDVLRKPSLRQKQGETSGEFAERLQETIGKEPEKYFARSEIFRLESEDDDFADDLHAIDQLRHLPQLPRNSQACFDFNSRCGYFEHCWDGVPLSDPSFKDQDVNR